MRYAVLVVAMVTVSGAPALALATDWSQPQSRTTFASELLGRLREEIRQSDDKALGALDREVQLVVGGDDPAEPQSSMSYAGREVLIPDAFIAETANLASMLQLTREGSDIECVVAYKSHMERTGSRTAPEGYLELPEVGCDQLRARLPLDAMRVLRAQHALEATLVFAYLHELGHQYHSHMPPVMPQDVLTQENQCAYLKAVEMRRNLEYEADAFAVDRLVELGQAQLLLAAGSIWLPPPMGAQAKDNPMLQQRIAIHPYAPLRYIKILDRASQELARSSSNASQLIEVLEQMREVQRKTVEIIAQSDRELDPCR